MATAMISSIESETATDSTTTTNTRNRRIEFHLARKPYTGIGRNSNFQLETLNPSATTAIAQYHKPGSQKPGPNPLSLPPVKKSGDFFENFFDPELNFRFTVRKIGAGLENLGNTCFLNSVLQCLTYTEPLAAYLQSGKHQASCRITGFCALCAIQKHVSRALQSTGRILAPKDLVSNLRCISRNFRNARQEDAHEYMVNLLESMHKCCLPKGVPSESQNAYEKSLVHKIFGGRLRSQVKCMQCSFCSDKIDPFLDLSLEISKADSLHKALVHFTAREQLDGGQKQYHCQHCKQKVKALKQLTVDKAPYVLTIHLKRFHATNSYQKINKKVQFEPTLNLKPFVSGSYEGDLTYTLYGVLVHVGQNTRSGHYYSFVRTASGFWYSVDDNRVTPVGERIVLEQKAYMLFYYRDRRNVGPKKPVLAFQEENMAAIGLRDKMLSPSNQELKESVQNGLFEKKYNDVDTPAVKIAELKHSSIKETQLKDKSSAHKRNGAMVAESTQKKGTDLEPSMRLLAKDLVKPVSIIHPKISTVSSLVPCGNGSVENSNIDRAILASTAVKVNDQKDEESCRKKNSTTESSNETSQAGSFLNGSVTDVAPEGLIESPNSSNLLNRYLPIIDPEQKRHKKIKKKVLKCLPSSMHLGSNILYGSSIRRKKKHKLRKNRSNLNRKQAKDIDMGPSTSDKTAGTSPALVHGRKRKIKSCSEDGQTGNINKKISKAADDLTTDIVNGELREKIDLYGATNDKLPHESSKSHLGIAVNKSHARELEYIKDVNRESMQNGMMSMLTRGLEETIVARWDGIDLPVSRDIESNPHKTVSIGYVPDEWDEEYDRGKRKKVKISQNEFGGSNPFQEIASKNARIKKARMDRLISENQPMG